MPVINRQGVAEKDPANRCIRKCSLQCLPKRIGLRGSFHKDGEARVCASGSNAVNARYMIQHMLDLVMLNPRPDRFIAFAARKDKDSVLPKIPKVTGGKPGVGRRGHVWSADKDFANRMSLAGWGVNLPQRINVYRNRRMNCARFVARCRFRNGITDGPYGNRFGFG